MNRSFSTDQWLQCYEQQQHGQTISYSDDVSATAMLTSTNPCRGGPNPDVASRRRRARASRRNFPATFLNANPSNFRALVQRFTGRSTARRKGPVTLNFASASLVEDTVREFGLNEKFSERTQASTDMAPRAYNYGSTLRRHQKHKIRPQREDLRCNQYYDDRMSCCMDPHGGVSMDHYPGSDDYDHVLTATSYVDDYVRDDDHDHHVLTSSCDYGRDVDEHDDLAMLEQFMMDDLYMLIHQ